MSNDYKFKGSETLNQKTIMANLKNAEDINKELLHSNTMTENTKMLLHSNLHASDPSFAVTNPHLEMDSALTSNAGN